MGSGQSAKEIVMSYITAMDNHDYTTVRSYLDDNLKVKGPAEAFLDPDGFINMMKMQNGKYEIKKIFAEDNDACLLYNFINKAGSVFFCSWYQVKDKKIVSIVSVFDPRAYMTKQG
jgi:predicted ester cyclase